jgi:di/tricarboxylate transporter
MEIVKNTTAKIKANPISSLVGVVGAFYLAKKYMPNSKWYVIGGVALVGGIAGAMVSSAIASRKTGVTKEMTK